SGPVSEVERSGSSRSGRLVERGPLDLAHLVGLEDVAFLHVVVALEVDAALEALGDLPHVFLEPLQRVDRRLVDDRAVPDDTDARAAANGAARHVRARDRPEPRDPDQRAHLGLGEWDLLADRAEHAD